jgi:hypothetical protein
LKILIIKPSIIYAVIGINFQPKIAYLISHELLSQKYHYSPSAIMANRTLLLLFDPNQDLSLAYIRSWRSCTEAFPFGTLGYSLGILYAIIKVREGAKNIPHYV